ncbi:MAG: Uma2 family endonuclease [Isosphaeraceae bacterium]
MGVLGPRARPAELPPTDPPGGIPPLENGDRLFRAEFERRYDAMPALKKAELIEGEVYVGPPVGYRRHGKPHGQLMTLIGTYAAGTPGLGAGANSTIRLDLESEPRPDVFLTIEPEYGGRIVISEDDYIEGAPDLIAEVAASSVSYDLGKKLHVYRRNEIREYIVWRVQDRAIDWFALRQGTSERLAPGPDGLLRSEIFPGLWLDPAALVRGDLATVLEIVRRGLDSPEHADFVARPPGA